MIPQTVKNCPLFAGIEESQFKPLLNCLSASRLFYAKDEFIISAESKPTSVGVVLSGGALVIQEDFWGNRMILSHIGPCGIFGEAFSCAEADRLPVSVVAAVKTEIMTLDCRKIVTSCASACVFHTQLIKNMMRILAEKNIMLTRKLEHLSKRTTREKLLSFLSSQAALTGGGAVEIPFNRQEMADYLCVDRSALSRELSLMQNKGLIRYNKNRFELLKTD